MEATASAPPAEAAPVVSERIAFEFKAKGGEYFRIWIVNLLLTIVTIGIYSAWAKVRRLRYFYGNTYLAGTSFEYHGKPIAILKGRLIALGAYLAFVLLQSWQPLLGFFGIFLFIFGIPWIVVRARLFQMRMSSYRNIRFGFHGTYRGAMGAFVGWPLLALITAYMLLFVFLQRQARYLLTNTSYGATRFGFNKTPGNYAGFFFISLLAAVALFAGFFVALKSLGLFALPTTLASSPQQQLANMAPLVALMIIALPIWMGIIAYFQKSYTNTSLDALELGPHRLECKMQTRKLWWIFFTNLIGIVLTLGLFYPWAKVRLLRYQFESMALNSQGGPDGLVASTEAEPTATGDAMADFFDVDFGL
jgi:uncharacterized membrane protein YjgN (DUF898 family)